MTRSQTPLKRPLTAISRFMALAFLTTSLLACVPGGEKPGSGDGDDDCKDQPKQGDSKDKDKKSVAGSNSSKDKDDKDDKKDDGKKKCDNTGTNPPPTGSKPIPFDPNRVCTIDKFKQQGGNPNQQLKKVDILFVMDTSGSMSDDWERVAGNIGSMVKELPRDIDIRYGVILGHVGGNHGKLFSAKGEKVVLDNQTMSTEQIANSLKNTFAAGMKVSDHGTGETLFYSLYHAVRDHAQYNKTRGFFRTDAALSVIFMSDEQEMGAFIPAVQPGGIPPRCDAQTEDKIKHDFYEVKGITTETTFAAVKALKGDMPVMTHAFINITPEDVFKTNKKTSSCLYESLGYGYTDMVGFTKGVLFSIKDDKAEGLSRCGKAIRESLEIVHDFKLSQPSQDVDAATIQGVVDGNVTPHVYQSLTNNVHLDYAGVFNSDIEIWYCKPDQKVVWNLVGAGGTPTETSINVAWKTPELNTRGKVLWGTSSASLVNTVDDTNFGTDHLVTVSGLNPSTKYYLQVVAKDDYGTEKRSMVLDVQTLTPPPVIWNIVGFAGQATETSVGLVWSTPELATQGRVSWGLSPNALNTTVSENAMAGVDHALNVVGLAPSTTYYFQATSRDSTGLEKMSAVIAVKTLTPPPPPPPVWNITGFGGVADVNAVALSWQTLELATAGRIVWGTDATALNNTASEAGSKINHAITVASLSPDTNYFFQAVSTDADGLEKRSAVVNIKTLIDPIVPPPPPPPPPPVWNLTGFAGLATETTVSLNWSTAELATNGRVIWGTSAGSLSNTAVEATATKDHMVNISGLTPASVYYFQAISMDSTGLEKASSVIAVQTLTPPPVVWNLTNFAGIAAVNSVSLGWNTAELDTAGKIYWGLTVDNLSDVVVETIITKNHAVVIPGLKADTNYYFQASSTDVNGLEKRSAVIQVKTLADPTPVVWDIVAFDGTTSVDSATLIWQTPGAATKATIYVGLSDTDFSFAQIPVDGFSDTHMVTVNGLTADTRYYFKVIAVDGFGVAKESIVITKKTKLP